MANTVTSGILNEAFVSALDGNVRKREFYNQIFRQDPEYSYFDFFDETGRKYESTERLVEHSEKGSAFENVTILSSAAVNTVDVNVTLSTGDHAAGKSYPVIGQQVRFANGAQGVIFAKSETVATAHVISIRRLRADQDVVAAAVNGTILVCFSNMKGEGTGQPVGRNPKIQYFSNKMQIFSETYEIEGSEEASEVYFKDGQGGNRFAVLGEEDTALRFRAEEYMGLFFGKASDANLTIDYGGTLGVRPVTSTRGLEETIRTQGMVEPYTAGSVNLSFFDTLIKRIDKRRGPKEYMIKPGINLDIDLDNIISTVMQQNGLSYDLIGGKGKAELLGFGSFKRGSYTFHKERDPLLSHDKLMGSTGHPYPGVGFFIPLDKMKDETSKKMEYAFAIRIKAGYKKNRDFKVWFDGANAPTPIGPVDKRSIYYLSEKLLQIMGGYRYLLTEAA